MGSQGKKRVRIESFTSSQALQQESKLLDLGNALFSHLSSILNLKCVWGFPSFNVLVGENLIVSTSFLSLKRGILAQTRISQCQPAPNAISRSGENPPHRTNRQPAPTDEPEPTAATIQPESNAQSSASAAMLTNQMIVDELVSLRGYITTRMDAFDTQSQQILYELHRLSSRLCNMDVDEDSSEPENLLRVKSTGGSLRWTRRKSIARNQQEVYNKRFAIRNSYPQIPHQGIPTGKSQFRNSSQAISIRGSQPKIFSTSFKIESPTMVYKQDMQQGVHTRGFN
ncbi:hypothetical protein Lal_00031984 [Lupinus albus]|nr:hypothetical protein Lal_00031984 [Lupinus albus]